MKTKTAAVKVNGLRFGKHGIRDGKTYFKCSYNYYEVEGVPTITIYGYATTGKLPASLNPTNGTDFMTDYFESDKAQIRYGSPEYAALAPWLKDRLQNIKMPQAAQPAAVNGAAKVEAPAAKPARAAEQLAVKRGSLAHQAENMKIVPAPKTPYQAPAIEIPKGATDFTVCCGQEGEANHKCITLPIRSFSMIRLTEETQYTVQFHARTDGRIDSQRDLGGLVTVNEPGKPQVQTAESKLPSEAEVQQENAKAREDRKQREARKPRAVTVNAGYPWPSNGFDRACWEEVIKGGTAAEVAARVVARFTGDGGKGLDAATVKYRTNPANVIKYHTEYVKEVTAAGLIK